MLLLWLSILRRCIVLILRHLKFRHFRDSWNLCTLRPSSLSCSLLGLLISLIRSLLLLNTSLSLSLVLLLLLLPLPGLNQPVLLLHLLHHLLNPQSLSFVLVLNLSFYLFLKIYVVHHSTVLSGDSLVFRNGLPEFFEVMVFD